MLTNFFEVADEHSRQALQEQKEDLSFMKPTADAVILDLRNTIDFVKWTMPGSSNLPLKSLDPDKPSPFSDPSTLKKQWRELESLFSDNSRNDGAMSATRFKDQQVLLLCYNGDTSRVGTSVLRAKGVEAVSLKGGMNPLRDLLPVSQTVDTELAAALDQLWRPLPLFALEPSDGKLMV